MKPAFAVSALLFVVSGVGSVCAAEIQLNGYTFQVPDGFSIELVADQPLVTYSICADFDEEGRLYVAEASGTQDWNKPQPHETRHRMLRLADTDNDGRVDNRTVFATFNMLAQGSMWHNGSLYVVAPPIIWKLTDEDGDGVAERREKWIETEEVTGCLNDLRGPYLGQDGWIYWSKGPAQQTYQVNGKPWTTTARHILRRHPDRQEVEQVMVGGMDNVVELAFSRDGERLSQTRISSWLACRVRTASCMRSTAASIRKTSWRSMGFRGPSTFNRLHQEAIVDAVTWKTFAVCCCNQPRAADRSGF